MLSVQLNEEEGVLNSVSYENEILVLSYSSLSPRDFIGF